MLTLISIKNTITPKKNVSRLDFGDTLNAIFIIKAMLVAIVKDPRARSVKALMTIAAVRQSSSQFEHSFNVTKAEFFKLSDQFYSSILKLNGLERVTAVILQEKVHIDSILQLALTDWTDYKLMNSLYVDILTGLQLGQIDAALNAIYRLGQALDAYALIARENHPDFFELDEMCLSSEVTGSI